MGLNVPGVVARSVAAESDPSIDFTLRPSAHTGKIVNLRFNVSDLTAEAGRDSRSKSH